MIPLLRAERTEYATSPAVSGTILGKSLGSSLTGLPRQSQKQKSQGWVVGGNSLKVNKNGVSAQHPKRQEHTASVLR